MERAYFGLGPGGLRVNVCRYRELGGERARTKRARGTAGKVYVRHKYVCTVARAEPGCPGGHGALGI